MEQKTNRSESLNELFGALAKAQAEIEIAIKDSTVKTGTYKYKYADFAEVIRVSRPFLTKNNLCVTQQLVPNERWGYLITTLGHSSGQFICSEMELKPTEIGIQKFGSYLTYARRYSYSSLVGIATEEDDDGKDAMPQENYREKEVAKQPSKSYNPPMPVDECIPADQEEILQDALKDHPDMAIDILQKLKYESLAEIKKSQFKNVLNHVIKKKAELAEIK